MTITDAPIHPTLAVADLAHSRSWYADKLGWEPIIEAPSTLVFQVGQSSFTLFESEEAGTAKNTVMNWNVADLRAEVARLRERGVAFDEFEFGDFKTVEGIMASPNGGTVAWFKDPDVNTIGISEVPGDFRIGAISTMIAAADLARAKAWYRDALGFEPVEEREGAFVAYKSGDSWFNLYSTQFAGTARNTVGVWRLRGIRDEVARLRGNGVAFEDYDFGDGDATVGGILSDAEGDVNAWFRDSEGNILALAEDRN